MWAPYCVRHEFQGHRRIAADGWLSAGGHRREAVGGGCRRVVVGGWLSAGDRPLSPTQSAPFVAPPDGRERCRQGVLSVPRDAPESARSLCPPSLYLSLRVVSCVRRTPTVGAVGNARCRNVRRWTQVCCVPRQDETQFNFSIPCTRHAPPLVLNVFLVLKVCLFFVRYNTPRCSLVVV
ncbi:hypothetical protein NP493_1299g00017 [Ridgeia piscesae]|uniref:Uncharacterized protein n=1 Tax=Ridgeia piscesae TaxID=27915 RepID=A0AAD9KAJ3_RIDPI|nr:hypothetical protein NP493_1299g00017 [Ridgeia piscesae]